MLSQVLSFGLQFLWDLINNKQLIVYLPLYRNVIFPANAATVNRYLLAVVSFDLMLNEKIESLIIEDELDDSDEPLNINF